MGSLEIFDAVMIVSPDQKEKLEKVFDEVYDMMMIDIVTEYPLSDEEGSYIVIGLEIMGVSRSKEEIQKFLTHLDFTCLRFEGSPYIFIPCEGDLTDLEWDYYNHVDVRSFIKDMLTINERYEMIFESNSYFSQWDNLTLIYNEPMDIEDYSLIGLTYNTPELFTQEDEYTISNDDTGETHQVDITIGIDIHNFQFIVLKKLENNKENIL